MYVIIIFILGLITPPKLQTIKNSSLTDEFQIAFDYYTNALIALTATTSTKNTMPATFVSFANLASAVLVCISP